MPNALNRQIGRSTVAGTLLYTVPAGATLTVIGLHCTNITDAQASVSVVVGGSYYGFEVPVPAGGGYEFIEPGSKFVVKAGDEIRVSSSADNAFDVHLSYLEQS